MTGSISVNGFGAAVDEVRHRLYVTSYTTPGTLSVFDTVTGAPLGSRSITSSPTTVEVNETTGYVYVAHQGVGDRVSVYQSDLTLLTELTLTNPWGPSINTQTNRVYVANTYGGDVWVVDGSTNTLLTTIPLAGTSTLGTAVDESRNLIYAVDRYSNELSVIDGATDTVVNTITTQSTPVSVAVDETLGRVYVLNQGTGTVVVYDSTTMAVVAGMSVGSSPQRIAVNDVTHRAYVNVSSTSSVAVIDTVTNMVVDSVPFTGGGTSYQLTVDESASKVFVPTTSGNAVVTLTDTLPPVTQNLGTTGLAQFQTATAGQQFDTINFDGLGFSDAQPITDQYAALGVTFTGIEARNTNDFTHSPPTGAQQTGYDTTGFTGDLTIDFTVSVASFGLYLNDNEADTRVRVTVDGGEVAALGVPRPAGAGGGLSTFYGFTAPTNSITRIAIDSPGDLFILDDLRFGRIPVTPVDTIDPTAAVTVPADGATFDENDAVLAAYTCDDGAGSGIASCIGPVANGAAIDTSPGPHTFAVTAIDAAGNDSTTTVSYTVTPAGPPADTIAPTAAIALPIDGSSFLVGDVVFAGYSCTDDAGGSGIDTCVGDVANGDGIDTSTVGPHTFSVTATDAQGNTSTSSVSYTVAASGDVDPPDIWINRPADGGTFARYQANVVVAFSCSDLPGSGIASCVGTSPNGSTLDTTTPGTYPFTVTATDVAGNTSTSTVTYTVLGGTTDTTPPFISVSAPTHLGRYGTGSSHTVVYTCSDVTPPSSGVATCTGTVPSGSLLDTSAPGFHYVGFTSTDNAGNLRNNGLLYEVVDDSDDDGLLDTWETDGIDVDHDGVIDLHLDQAPYNADPNHRDVFVEMDYMTCALTPGGCVAGDRPSQAPQAGAVDDVITSFAAAPVSNPDGTTGIRLHVTVDEAVAELKNLPFGQVAGPDNDFEDIRSGAAGACNGHFGTAAERADPNCPKLIQAKAIVFRYGLWAHSWAGGFGSSGIAEMPGNDFLISTGGDAASWAAAAGTLRAAEAGTFMHELGHTWVCTTVASAMVPTASRTT